MSNLKSFSNILDGVDGHYLPSFFIIQLDTNIDPLQFNKNNLTHTIVHEFVHFIQDTSTCYGLTNISATYARAFNFYNIPDKEIKLPYQFIGNVRNELINRRLFKKYFNRTKIDISTPPKEPLIKPEFPINNINVKITSKKGKIKDFYHTVLTFFITIWMSKSPVKRLYNFGSHAIMEGMAAAIEDKLYPPSVPKSCNCAPYDLPKAVIKSIYPDMENDNAFLVALCDASLMYYNSAEIFIKILRKMKREEFSYSNLNEIYEYCFNYLKPDNKNVKDFFIENVNNAKSAINNMVNAPRPEYYQARDWIIDIIEDYKNLRLNDFSFLSIIMTLPQQQALQEMRNLTNRKSSPFIVNNEIKFGAFGTITQTQKDYGFYWFNLYRMYDFLFESKAVMCPFWDYCGHRDGVCEDKPWLVDKNKGFYCNYEQFAQMFALYKRKIKNK